MLTLCFLLLSNVPACFDNRIVFYEEPLRVLDAVRPGRKTKTHHTPPHLQRLHTTHNGCAYLCVLSVSRSVVSLCVFVTAPLVPFAFRRRVAGLGWSCFSRIRSQQQITAISPHTITAARNVTAVSNTTAVLSIQTTYCSLGRNYE